MGATQGGRSRYGTGFLMVELKVFRGYRFLRGCRISHKMARENGSIDVHSLYSFLLSLERLLSVLEQSSDCSARPLLCSPKISLNFFLAFPVAHVPLNSSPSPSSNAKNERYLFIFYFFYFFTLMA